KTAEGDSSGHRDSQTTPAPMPAPAAAMAMPSAQAEAAPARQRPVHAVSARPVPGKQLPTAARPASQLPAECKEQVVPQAPPADQARALPVPVVERRVTGEPGRRVARATGTHAPVEVPARSEAPAPAHQRRAATGTHVPEPHVPVSRRSTHGGQTQPRMHPL